MNLLTSQEIKRYSVFMKKHISIIDPKIIILMGSSAMESLTGINTKISLERGKWKEIILKNKTYPVMISYNPSYLIRFPENKKYSWEDLKKINIGDLLKREARKPNEKLLKKDIVKILYDEIAPLYVDRPGGYTRIVKLGHRDNDRAPVSIIEFVDMVDVSTSEEKETDAS